MQFQFLLYLILKCEAVKFCEKIKQLIDNNLSYKLKSCCWDLAKGKWFCSSEHANHSITVPQTFDTSIKGITPEIVAGYFIISIESRLQ